MQSCAGDGLGRESRVTHRLSRACTARLSQDRVRMGSIGRRVVTAYETFGNALGRVFTSQAEWYRIVIAADQQPRFGDLCHRCGAEGAWANRENVNIEAESGLEPGARLGVRCLAVPRCRVCSGWQVAVGLVFLAVGVFLLTVVAWTIFKSITHPRYRYSGRPLVWQDLGRMVAVVAFVLLLGGCAYRAFRCRMQVFERADGISYLFLDRRVAEVFALRNAPLLPRTSPEFLPPSDRPQAVG